MLDASVVVKLLVEEPGSTQAVALLDRPDARLAPDWLAVELACALWNKVRFSGFDAGDAEQALAAFPRFIHRLVPSAPLVAPAFALGCRLEHPVYDCLYLALAKEEAAQLITADKRFHAAAMHGGEGDRVELLQW